MGHLLSLKLDVKKIPKEKYFNGEKGVYIDLTIGVDDEPNEYGQTVKAWVEQTKEERDEKMQRVFVGNGTGIWSDGKPVFVRQRKVGIGLDSQANQIKKNDLPFEL